MRPAAIVLLVLIVSTAAGIPLWHHYTQPRDISVCVLTDPSFRQRPDWEAVVRSRFQEVTRIYDKSAGIRWKVVSMVQWDPTAQSPDLDTRREDLATGSARCTADVVVSLTGQTQGDRTGSVLAFSHAAVVVDSTSLTETQNTLRLAQDLALLFGAPVEDAGAGTLMTSPPESDRLSARAARLIHRLRGYDFASSTEALEGSWGNKAASALAGALAERYPKPLARGHQSVGASLEAEHHHAGAIMQFQEAVKIAPEDGTARSDLAMALMQDSHPDAAISELRLAVQLKPDDAGIRTELAALLAVSEDPNDAVEQLRRAVELNPNDINIRMTLGTILLKQMHRIDDAIAAYQEALKLDPSSAAARQRLTQAILQRSEAEEGLNQARQRAARSPDDANARLQLAVAEWETGNSANAARDCEEALTLNPKLGAAHELLAGMRYFDKDYRGAWKELKIASSFGEELPRRFTDTIRRKAEGTAP